jgi:hypothetical protein
MPSLSLETIDLEAANLEAIRSELEEVIRDSAEIVTQQETDFDTRLATWPGQSADGRKWRKNLGKEAMPWEGASDMRIREADAICNEQVDVCKNAWNNATLQSYALREDSLPSSARVNTLLSWLLKVHLKEKIRPEVELFAQWRQGFGMAVMGVFWEQERRLEIEELDIQALAAKVAEKSPEEAAAFVEELRSLFTDPLREEEALESLRAMGDGITRAKARKMRDELLESGVCRFPKITVSRSLPCWEALRPFVDVFFPPATHDIQKAPWVAKSEWLSETDLRDRIETEDYNPAWVEEAIQHKGKESVTSLNGWYTTDRDRLRKSGLALGNAQEDLVQIFHVYYKGTEQTTEAPVLMCTVMSPNVPKLTGKHTIAGYRHGKYPFVAGVRERISRAMTDSRSVPEIAGPVQSAIKSQFDSRTDATNIANIPPLITPLHRANTRMEFGPGCQHAERKSGELRWMPVPTGQLGASVEVEAAARAHSDRYFGRFSDAVNPTVSQLRASNLVEDFLGEMRQCARQTVQLAQQYLPEMVIERVTGGRRVPFRVSREEIQGEFDITFTYDPRNMDMELVAQKLKMFKEVLSFDSFGVTDRTTLTNRAMSWIDPNLAEELVGDSEAASDAEVENEKQNFALIMAGVEPPMRESGQNFGLRLKVLQSLVQGNPQAGAEIQGREDRMALFENRVKHLQFMLQQQENATTGRVGVEKMQG